MIYSWIGSLFDGCAPQFGTIFVICAIVNALLCILLIPICIRLAGKLVAQVFKYRYIVKNHLRAFDDDRKVIIAYYQHFQIFMGIILNILGFCIFNSIYQIYMSVYVKNIQIGMQCIVGFVAGAFAEAFQEGIILFGVTLLLQIAYYFKEKNVHLNIIITVIMVRISYVFMLELSVVLIRIFGAIGYPYIPSLIDEVLYFGEYYIHRYLYTFDTITRVFTVFAFMRMCIRIVQTRINEFINHINSNFIERHIFEDKIRAYKLMKVAAWGTYSSTIFCAVIYICISVLNYSLIPNFGSPFTFSGIILISILVSIFSILPSVLYSNS